jgi:hypothetical protein
MSSAPAPAVLFGGADEATYLAVAGLTTALTAQPPGISRAIKGSTPLELGVLLAPRLQPAAATSWEMLPLVEVGEQPLIHAPGAAAGVSGDSTGDWIVWGVMLLALCLVLSAFLI